MTEKSSNRNFLLFAGLSVFSLLIGACGFAARTQVSESNPRILSASEVPRIVRAIPSYTRFAYSGLAFFNDKLYATSNIGLLEYERGNLARLYKWYDRDDVVSGPWVDKANQSLWVHHNGINRLIRFDGGTWQMTDLPRPREGHTRGDMLQGFEGISSDNTFWLQGGNHVWRWNPASNSWTGESVPNVGSFVSIVPVRDRVFFIMRHGYVPYLEGTSNARPGQADSDTVHFFQNGRWQELPNRSGISFFAQDIVSGGDAAYILTRDSKLLRLTTSEITAVETVGEIEALTVTSAGNLLASFRHVGIFEHAGEWRRRFQSLYPASEAEHWAYLSERNGQVAFAITTMPQLRHDDEEYYPGQTTLWFSNSNELNPISLGHR